MESLTKERAQRILSLIGMGKDGNMIFEEDGYDYEHTLIVWDEFERLEKEIGKKIKSCNNELELAEKLRGKWLNPKEVIQTVISRRFIDYDGYPNFLTLKNDKVSQI